jgi:inner membrane protein
MPTIMTHSVVALSAGCLFDRAGVPKRFWVLAIIAAVLPDADVIGYQYFYIPYGHILGHRGFFHSPFFAALFSLGAVSIFFRQERVMSRRWWAYVLFFFAVGASHGLLDAMTNGGRGIALLSPFSNQRYFLPWTPIEVSPLGIRAFIGQRGLAVMKSEILWIWIPVVSVAVLGWIVRTLSADARQKNLTASGGPARRR